MKLEFEFLRNGLENGEGAVYATTIHPGIITLKMEEFGIDVPRYFRRNQLNICYVRSPFVQPRGYRARIQSTLVHFFSNLKKPVRGVGRAIPEIDTLEGIIAEMQLEREFHSAFSNFPGSFLCSFPIDKINDNKFGFFLLNELESHDSAIFLPKFGKPSVMNL